MARRRPSAPLALALALAAALVALPLATAAAQTQAKQLAAPGKLWAAQVSPTEVTLTWGTVAGAVGYRVFVQNPKGELVRLGDLSASGTRYVAGTGALSRVLGPVIDQVRFVVRAIGAGGVLGQAGSFNPVAFQKAGTGAKAAAAPTSVRVAETMPGVVTLTWNEVEGATAYAIGRSRGTSGLQRLCDICPTGGRFVDTVPEVGVRYYYRITGLTPNGATRPTLSDSIVPTGVILAGGGTGATPAAGADADPKGHAEGVSITANPVLGAPRIVRVLVQLAQPIAQGVTARLMRQVCNGPLQVVDRIVDHAQFQLDDALGLDFPDCDGSGKLAVRYTVQFSDPKGLVANSKAAIVELSGEVATTTDTAAATPDMKALAEGVTITATPRWRGGPVVIRVVVNQVLPRVTAELVRHVCGQQTVLRTILGSAAFQMEDVLEGLGVLECDRSAKMLVSYTVRMRDAKGLVANSKAAVVELVPEDVATAPPATPTNLRIARLSNGSRILTWDAVAGATSYRIERVVGAKGAWTLLRTVDGTVKSYTDATAVSEPPRYRITAVNSAGSSGAGIFP